MQHHDNDHTIQRPVEQIYSKYTSHDFLVWKNLFDRQLKILEPNVSSACIDALQTIQFTGD